MSDPNEQDADDELIEVIELDDDSVLPDTLEDVDLNNDDDEEDDDDENLEDVDMAAGGEEVKDMSDLVFKQHTDAVFSVSIDPKTCDLAVTGGQDDRAFVWRLSTGNVVFECKGHTDSVTCVGFSYDGAYVATADLSGVVKVWKVENQQEVFSFESSDAEWMRWHPGSHVLFLGTVDGEVWMWKVPSGECKTMQGHGCTASAGILLPDGKRACVGYDDGAIKVWDLKSNTAVQYVTGPLAHKSAVICLDCHPDNNLVISGSTDVTAKIINSSTGKVLSSFDCGVKDSDGENSVEAVGFCHIQPYAATGTVSGVLSIWDTNTQISRQTCHHEAGIVGLQWDRLSPLVYTSCLDGVVRLWDSRSGQMASQWTGHTDSVLNFDISRDGASLVTVSEDKTARVFSLSSPDR